MASDSIISTNSTTNLEVNSSIFSLSNFKYYSASSLITIASLFSLKLVASKATNSKVSDVINIFNSYPALAILGFSELIFLHKIKPYIENVGLVAKDTSASPIQKANELLVTSVKDGVSYAGNMLLNYTKGKNLTDEEFVRMFTINDTKLVKEEKPVLKNSLDISTSESSILATAQNIAKFTKILSLVKKLHAFVDQNDRSDKSLVKLLQIKKDLEKIYDSHVKPIVLSKDTDKELLKLVVSVKDSIDHAKTSNDEIIELIQHNISQTEDLHNTHAEGDHLPYKESLVGDSHDESIPFG